MVGREIYFKGNVQKLSTFESVDAYAHTYTPVCNTYNSLAMQMHLCSKYELMVTYCIPKTWNEK